MKRMNNVKNAIAANIMGSIVIGMTVVAGVTPITVFAQDKEAECICEEKCTRESINEECAVCLHILDEGIKSALHTCELLFLGFNGCTLHFVSCGSNLLKHFSIQRLNGYGCIFEGLSFITHNAGIYYYLCHSL